MTTLSAWLNARMRENNWAERDAAAALKLSKTAVRNILKDERVIPKLETLGKISEYFGVPVWRLVEMCGINPGLPGDPSDLAARVARLVDAQPEYAVLAEGLLRLDPADLAATLQYLEATRLLRERDRGRLQ